MSHAIATPRRIDVKPGNWRLALRARSDRLRLQTLAAVTDEEVRGRVLAHLRRAQELSDDPQNPIEAWSGSQVERAWIELRLAEESLIRGTSRPGDIIADAHAALAHGKGRLGEGDNRIAALAAALPALPALPDQPTPEQLAVVQALSVQVTIAAHELSDAQHREQREFRNRLRLITLALAVLVGGLAVVCLLVPVPTGWIPVPAGVATGHAVAGAVVLGAVGALFSAVPSLTQAPANTTTFNPIAEQAALKIVVGGCSALVGLVAVAAGIQSSGTGADATSPAGFAMMCALFGAMQEAITRFADQKAVTTKPATSS